MLVDDERLDELHGKSNIFGMRSFEANTGSEQAVAAFGGVDDLPFDFDQIAKGVNRYADGK